MRLPVALLAVAVVLTGCTGSDDGTGPPSPPTGDETGPLPARLAVLADVPVPAFDPAAIVGWHREFVTTFVKRDSQSPTNLQAAEHIRSGLEQMGWLAEIRTYLPRPPQEVLPLPTDPTPGVGVRVVIGVKEGPNADHVVGWVSHYDTQTATIEGAYDNGSGTAMALALARELAGYVNNKTLVVMFFDSEEIGLVASDYFVQTVVANDDAQWDLVLGFDMVGINCPGHEWPLIALPNL
ncbi:MAG: M28 family peptidase, partial [bacterium]